MEQESTIEITPTKSKVQFWQELVTAQAGSLQKVQDFCRAQGVNYRVFYYWKRKLGGPGRKSSRFIVMGKRAQAATVSPRIHLPNGVRIELGEGLECEAVGRFLRSLCGLHDQTREVKRAKP